MVVTILDHALAAADEGLKIFRIRPLDKRPLKADWQAEATTDVNTILGWFRDNKHINYGVRTGSANDLYVVDLDGPEASAWWRSTGITSGTRVTTPSGPDRTHLYFRTDGEVELPNTKATYNKDGVQTAGIGPHVDTRGEGGYVVGPGSRLPTGTYTGTLTNIPDAPAELLALLPEKQTFEYEPFDGVQAESASPAETRKINYVATTLGELPRVWVEGAGWRSTVYQMGCWLARMVNSSAYALDEQGAIAILMANTPTDETWGQKEILEQWRSAVKSTAGQFAELPPEEVPNLLDFVTVGNMLPEYTTHGENFMELLLTPIANRSPGALWKARQDIFIECYRAGLTPQQAVSVVFGSRAASDVATRQDGLETLWAESEKPRSMVATSNGEGIEAPAADERPPLEFTETARMELMPANERDYARSVTWFGSEYMAWAEQSVSMMNAPYHRMNYVMVLSLLYAPHGIIPLGGGIDATLNIYSATVGETTTGKTEAMKLERSVLKNCLHGEAYPDIGGDASPNALIETLIARDGKASWFNKDEAHGQLREMKQGGWLSGLPEKLTELYDGRVPMMLRNKSKDLSGVDATAYFCIQYAGTMKGMSSVLEPSDWESGWLNRFIWAIGEKKERTRDSMKIRLRRNVVAGADPMQMQKYWSAAYGAKVAKLHSTMANPDNSIPVDMDITPEVEERHNDLVYRLSMMTDGHQHEHMLKPTFARMAFTILKYACLIALSFGTRVVTAEHHMIAVEAGEEWATNIVTMVSRTTETGFTKQVNDIELYIAAQKDRTVRVEKVYAYFKLEKRKMDELITQLIAEGRVERPRNTDQSETLRIKESRQS